MNTKKRKIGLFGAVILTVGFIIGSSVFVMVPTIAGIAGPSVFLAYAFASIPTILCGIAMIQLSGVLPVTGGPFIAVSRYISPSVSFVMAAGAVVAMAAANCLNAYGAAAFIRLYLPEANTVLIAFIILGGFCILNLFDIKLMTFIEGVMVVMLILTMLIIGLGGMPSVSPANMDPLFPNGMTAFFMAIAIAIFSWLGLTALANFSGDIKNPKRNIPMAIFLSIIVLFILYVTVSYSIVGNMNWKEVSELGAGGTMVAISNFLSGPLVNVLTIGAIMAILTTVNAIIMVSAKSMIAFTNQKVLPPVFGKINRFGSPYVSVIIFSAATMAGVAFAGSFEDYALMAVYPGVAMQFLTAYAMYRLPKVDKESYDNATIKLNKFWLKFSLIGNAILSVVIIVFAILNSIPVLLVTIIMFALLVVYWFARKNYLKNRGLDLTKLASELSEETQSEIDSINE